MNKYIVTLLLILMYVMSSAQRNPASSEPEPAQWSIKFSPLGLIEADQAASLATEVRVMPCIGIQVEGSYIFNTLFLASERIVSNTRGFRVVPEIRYYDINFRKKLQRYIGLQMSYKQVDKDVEEWIYKTNHTRLETIHMKKSNFTTTFIGGIQNNSHLIGFDLNVGLGFKYKTLNNNATFNDQNVFNTYFGETLGGYYPQLSATFKLCVKLM